MTSPGQSARRAVRCAPLELVSAAASGVHVPPVACAIAAKQRLVRRPEAVLGAGIRNDQARRVGRVGAGDG